MAVSARTQALMDQRSAGLRRRVLAPQNNTIASISRKSVLKETEIMVRRYNDGEVGNDEMMQFLETTRNNPGLNESDRSDIENQIRDFTLRIAKDNLEARYKNTIEGSAERIMAGQQLAAFYESRANNLEPGTPAQSQALENAGIWKQRVMQDQVAIQKRARAMERARMEQQVNMYPSNTSENAAMKAEMFRQLADQAMQDGDELAAQRFLAQANYEETRAGEVARREEEQAVKQFQTANRKQIVDAMNILADQYNDGGIDENQYLEALVVVDQRINELGDTALALSLNRTVNTVQKNLEKGGLRRGTTASGLPTVLGKGPVGNQSTDWDQSDYNYSDNLQTLQSALQSGEIDAQDYQENLMAVVSERQKQIDSRLETLSALAAENPNQKITYEGRKQRVGDLVQSVQREQQSFMDDYGAVMSGRGALFMVPPDQMNQSGSIKKSGKGYASYRILDPSTLTEEQKMQYAVDDTGVYHPVQRKKNYIDPGLVEDVNGYQFYTDELGTQQRVYVDSSGNPYTWGGQEVSLYKPGQLTPEVKPYTQGEIISMRGLQPAVVQAQDGTKIKNPIAPENLSVDSVRPSLPSPKNFEQTIQPQKPVNLDLKNLPQGLTTDLSKMSQPSATPKIPDIKPVQQPVNINPQQLPAGLTPAQPQNLKQQPQTLATKIQPVEVLKQSPFNFLKNKIESFFKR